MYLRSLALIRGNAQPASCDPNSVLEYILLIQMLEQCGSMNMDVGERSTLQICTASILEYEL